ncbi:hypothetical protein KJ567_06650 [Candidatus Bipolaricaulota bacterium]|nr:hypothetical protein [Candidatus Bipolaricaulota bacterium]
MEVGKRIGNVNVLDLRNATEESISAIERIGNVNILIFAPETAALVSRLGMGNVNCSVKLPAGSEIKTVMGHLRINRDYFAQQTEPISLVVMGHILVEAGTPGELIDKGIESIVVMGNVICPEPLVGVVQSKIGHIMGHVRPYPPAARLFLRGLELDVPMLESFDDETDLAVVGQLQVTSAVSNDLLERKIGTISAFGHVICWEENARTLRPKLAEGAKHFTVIPAGHRLHQDPLTLDPPTLQGLQDAKLYCTESVIIDAQVTAEALEGHLASLVSTGMILCPGALKSTFGSVCDLLENQVIFYEGELWTFDAEHALRASRLEYLEGKATAVVTGELTIDPDVPAKTIAERFDRIHNLGEIHCTPDQMGAVEARLGLHDGELVDSTAEIPEDEASWMGNANVLAL